MIGVYTLILELAITNHSVRDFLFGYEMEATTGFSYAPLSAVLLFEALGHCTEKSPWHNRIRKWLRSVTIWQLGYLIPTGNKMNCGTTFVFPLLVKGLDPNGFLFGVLMTIVLAFHIYESLKRTCTLLLYPTSSNTRTSRGRSSAS